MWETWVQSLGWKDPLEKGKATHSSILGWRIPLTVEIMRLQRVGHHWAALTHSYWSRLPFPSPGDLSYPGIKPTSLMSPALAGGFFTTSATWAPPWDVQRRMKFINNPPRIYCGRQYSRCWECCRWACNWSRKNTSNKVVKRHQDPQRQGTVFC